MVITTVQVPVVPEVNFPAVDPPDVAEAEHPDVVNLVPLEIGFPTEGLDICADVCNGRNKRVIANNSIIFISFTSKIDNTTWCVGYYIIYTF